MVRLRSRLQYVKQVMKTPNYPGDRQKIDSACANIRRMNNAPARLILVRHAQGSLGTSDYDRLSPLGHRQAGLLAKRLQHEVARSPVVHGALTRHCQTADYFGHDGERIVDGDLDEYHVADLLVAANRHNIRPGHGLPLQQALADPVAYLADFLEFFPTVLEAWQAGRLECSRNGLWQEFALRVEGAGHRLLERAKQADTRSVVVVSSAGVISTLCALLLKHDLAWQRRLNVAMYNSAVTELAFQSSDGWRLITDNCVDHLNIEGLRSLA